MLPARKEFVHNGLVKSLIRAIITISLVVPWILFGQIQSDSQREFGEVLAKAKGGDAGAQVNLGLMYAFGTGEPKDEAEAVKWYRKAADQGNADGQVNLGLMYAFGTGVPKDEAEAVKWYRKAADQGNAGGQCKLGIMYNEGNGVPKDEAEAVKWYRKAADQGNVNGQILLGLMYQQGNGVPKDETEAYKWILLAGAQGNKPARKEIPLIEARLTPDQRADGQKMAREFKPKPSK